MAPADWSSLTDLEVMRRCRRGLRQAQLSHQRLAPRAVQRLADPAALVVGRDSYSVRYRWIVWGVAHQCFISQHQLAAFFAMERKTIRYGLRQLETLTRIDPMIRQIFKEVQEAMLRDE